MSAEAMNLDGPMRDPLAPESPLPAGPVARRPGWTAAVVRNNLMLACMFAGGLFGVYLLSLRGGPVAASANQIQAEQQVETALSQFSRNGESLTARKTQALLESFYHEAKQRQIPLAKLRANPFAFKLPASSAGPAIVTKSEPPVSIEDAAASHAVRQFRLQSILNGGDSRPVAMISNNLLTEGQSISGWKVTQIRSQEVVLTWKDQTYVLKLAE